MAHQFSDDERKRLAKQGKAMSDGGYPIRNREDLVNAVRAYGRGNNKEERQVQPGRDPSSSLGVQGRVTVKMEGV